MSIKLTKSVVDRIEPPTDRNQALYQDSVLTGFALRVTKAGVKSFVINKRIKGKPTCFTIARYGTLTVEQARIEAQKLLGDIARGLDPVAEKRVREARSITLRGVMEDYLAVHSWLNHKTVDDYRRVVLRDLKDWADQTLGSISRDAVANRHARLGQHSPSRANTAMRVLRALFRFAKGQYEDAEGKSLFPDNPVDRLNHTRAWFPTKRRKTVITASQLGAWFEAVQTLRTEERGSQAETHRRRPHVAAFHRGAQIGRFCPQMDRRGLCGAHAHHHRYQKSRTPYPALVRLCGRSAAAP
jgi:hypothetical protein